MQYKHIKCVSSNIVFTLNNEKWRQNITVILAISYILYVVLHGYFQLI